MLKKIISILNLSHFYAVKNNKYCFNLFFTNPAPRRKSQSVSNATTTEQLPGPVEAWGPNVLPITGNNSQASKEQKLDDRMQNQVIVCESAPVYGKMGEKENASSSAIDNLVSKVYQLCITGVSKDEKEPVLKEVLKASCCINEKYAIIDFSGLIEDNKVNKSFLREYMKWACFSRC